MPQETPSSSIIDKWSHDVFISYSCLDFRSNFPQLLDQYLDKEKLRVVVGDRIRLGEGTTSSAPSKAIHKSRIAIIVFSKNYANSGYRLQELVQILKRFKEEGRLIYPVFYDVDRLDVLHQTGSYAEALKKIVCEEYEEHEVEEWGRALSEAAQLPGYHFQPRITNEFGCTDDSECIEVIVKRVTAWMTKKEGEEEEEHDDNAKEGEEEDVDTIHEITDETTDFSLCNKVKEIESGAYGTVYVVQHRVTGALYALKELNIGRVATDESIENEIKIFSKLEEHPNIVKYCGYKVDVRGRLCLFTEYIHPGSLHDYITERGKLDGPLIQKFTAQILTGLDHLHRNNIVHRDLKPGNLLVDSNKNIKLVDFGVSKMLAESVGTHSKRGTILYAAPEVLEPITYESLHEAFVADIWSLGCVIIKMFSGHEPRKSHFFDLHPKIPEELSPEGKDFLKLCFIRNPVKRPSAATLLNRPFVKPQAGVLMEESTRIDDPSC